MNVVHKKDNCVTDMPNNKIFYLILELLQANIIYAICMALSFWIEIDSQLHILFGTY